MRTLAALAQGGQGGENARKKAKISTKKWTALTPHEQALSPLSNVIDGPDLYTATDPHNCGAAELVMSGATTAEWGGAFLG